jgi:hypothetical protein
LRTWLRNLFLFILSFYKISVVCGFGKIIQVSLIVRVCLGVFNFFFLNCSWLFITVYFFLIKLQKIVLAKNHVITLFKVTKIKGCEDIIVHSHSFHCRLQCFAFFFCYWIFVMIFFFNFFLLISSFNIGVVEDLTS